MSKIWLILWIIWFVIFIIVLKVTYDSFNKKQKHGRNNIL